MLRCSKVGELAIVPGKLSWPWVAFSPDRSSFALPVGRSTLGVYGAAAIDREARLDLPEVLSVPSEEPSHDRTRAHRPGLHTFAVHPDGRTVVGLGWHDSLPVACVLRAGLGPELVDLGTALGDLGPMAATFSADGEALWLSAESQTDAAIVRLRFRDFSLQGKVAFPPPPPPATHELLLHPAEGAVLLTMACGQDGTFVRVARETDGKVTLVAGEGDDGLESCGSAEATEDGSHVCLVNGYAVELRRWPELKLVKSVELGDGLLPNYNGVRIGGRFVVSATFEQDDGSEDERALVFGDALKLEDDAPAPPGMWAGRVGRDRIVTVGRQKGESRGVLVYVVEV